MHLYVVVKHSTSNDRMLIKIITCVTFLVFTLNPSLDKDKGSFALSFMRIMNEDRTIVGNKSYHLPLVAFFAIYSFSKTRYTLSSYKIKKKSIVVDVNEPTDTSYLKLPPSGEVQGNKIIDPNGRFVLRKGEFVRVKTSLYSTKFTQNSM